MGVRHLRMHQNDGLRFHTQFLVLRQNMELMYPVIEIIQVRGGLGKWYCRQPERQAALRLVVPRTEPQFVVTLRYGPS